MANGNLRGILGGATIAFGICALAASGAASATVTVAVTPAHTAHPANHATQFSATVSGSTNQNVSWLVNGVPGGAPSIGTISAAGLYLAPADVAVSQHVTVQAVAEADPLAIGKGSITSNPRAVSSTIFHVAITGNDGNNGSAANPWRTIQHAANVVPAGGTVQVHSGVYKEAVTITRSGNAAAGYTTIEASPGEAAVIDGTGLAVGNGGQQGLINLHNANWVRVLGFEIRNFQSNSANKVPVGIYVYGFGDHIEILRNHVHDIVTTVTSSNGDALGVAIYGNSATPISNLIIDGNEIDHLVTGYSESLSVNGNVQNWQVTHNTIHDNNNIGIDAIGFEKTAPTPAIDQARDGWIADNSVYNISSLTNPAYNNQPGADGIYVDGGTRITIERNLIDHTDLGLELASEHKTRTTSQVTARNNLIQFSYVTGVSIGGYAANVGGTDHCSIVNNTLFGNDTSRSGSGELQIQYNASNNLIENNILYANQQGLLVNSFVASTAQPAMLDRNLYDTSSGPAASQWIWNRKTLSSLTAFQTASQGETNGLVLDPRFADTTAANLDLHLAKGSKGINSGANLGVAIEGSFDFDNKQRVRGKVIDRGAYEH